MCRKMQEKKTRENNNEFPSGHQVICAVKDVCKWKFF